MDALGQENPAALEKGFENLARHIDNVRKFGVPAVVCVNRFSADTDEENTLLEHLCETAAVDCVTADHWAEGGAGATELAKAVLNTLANKPARFELLYPDDMPLWLGTLQTFPTRSTLQVSAIASPRSWRVLIGYPLSSVFSM